MTTLAQAAAKMLSRPVSIEPAFVSRLLSAVHEHPTLAAEEAMQGKGPLASLMPVDMDGAVATTPAGRSGSLAIISIRGVMSEDPDLFDRIYMGALGYHEIASAIDEAAGDDSISAVVLDMSTPGGTCQGVSDALAAIDRCRESKPVYAVAHDVITSSGMYLASRCDDVLATPTSELGSIGVMVMLMDESEWFAKRGTRAVAVSTGSLKAVGAPGLAITEDHEAHVRRRIEPWFDGFVESVAAFSGQTAEQIRAMEAGVYSAMEAQAMGLCKVVPSFAAALAAVERATESAPASGRKDSRMKPTNTPRQSINARAMNPEDEKPNDETSAQQPPIEEEAAMPEDEQAEAGMPDYTSMDEEDLKKHMAALKAAMGDEDEPEAKDDQEDEPAAEDPKMPGDEEAKASGQAFASRAQLTDLVKSDDGTLSTEAKAFIFDAQQAKLTIAQAANQWVKANASIAQQAVQHAGLVDRSRPLATVPVSAKGAKGGYRDINEAKNAIAAERGISKDRAYAIACNEYPELARAAGHAS